MTLIMLVIVVAVALAQVPVARRMGASPALARRAETPRGAATLLLLANLTILVFTFGSAIFLASVPGGPLFPQVLGPTLSFLAWSVIARAMPQQGAARWGAAFAGMSPYLVLAAAATYWTSTLDPGLQTGEDPFMAGIAGLLLTVIGLGAFLAGLLTVTLTKHRPQP